MAVQKGLGRGLGALFQEEPLEVAAPEKGEQGQGAVMLEVANLRPNPNQPRKTFDDEALNDLAASIKEQGLLQPILVRPLPGELRVFEIVAGERRWRASQLAGLSMVPVMIRDLSEQQTLALALIENLQREDLNPLEEAWGIQRLREEFQLSQEELARQLGKSRSAIANALRLLNLSENAQQDLREGRISAGHARALLSFGNPEQMEATRKRILAENLSVREVEALAFAAKEESAAPAEQPAAESTQEATQPAEKAKKPKSAAIAELQNRISGALQLPVKISGQEDKGRLNIKYSSKEELQALLEKLGL